MLCRFLPAILACCSLLHAQQASTPEPQYGHQYNAVMGGQLVVLERQTAVTDTKSRRFFVITPSTTVFESINNPASPIRVGPNTHFLVRLATGDRDPQTLIHLQKLTPAKKDRQVPIVTYKASEGASHRPGSQRVRSRSQALTEAFQAQRRCESHGKLAPGRILVDLAVAGPREEARFALQRWRRRNLL